jgi:hypothetical protein
MHALETIVVAEAVETDVATIEGFSDVSEFSIELVWALACGNLIAEAHERVLGVHVTPPVVERTGDMRWHFEIQGRKAWQQSRWRTRYGKLWRRDGFVARQKRRGEDRER